MDQEMLLYTVGCSTRVQKLFEAVLSEVDLNLILDHVSAMDDVAQTSLPILFICMNSVDDRSGHSKSPCTITLYTDSSKDSQNVDLHTTWSTSALRSVIQQSLLLLQSENKSKQLEFTSQKYEALTRALPDLTFILDSDGLYVDTLTEDESLLYTGDRNKLVGHSIYEILPTELTENVSQCIKEVIDSGETQQIDYSLDLADKTHWFHARISRLDYVYKSKQTVICTCRDVSETKNLLGELEQLNTTLACQFSNSVAQENDALDTQRYREIAEMLPQTIIEIDVKGNILYFNAHTEQLSGYSPEELKKGNVRQFMTKETWCVARERLRSVSTEIIEDHKYELVQKSGNTIPIQVYSSPLLKDGELIGRRCLILDITEQTKRESMLKEQALFVKFNPAPCFKVDVEGKIVSCNPATIKFFKENITHKHITEIFPQEQLHFDQQHFTLSKLVGDTTLNFTAVRGLYSDHVYFYGADITEIIEAEYENNRLLHNLQERIKKIDCLYQVTKTIQSTHSEEEIIENVLRILPYGYQYPKKIGIKIVYKDIIKTTDNYSETPLKQLIRIRNGVDMVGYVDVRYIEMVYSQHENAFLKEEHQMLSAVCYLLGTLAEKSEAERENVMLRKAVEQNPVGIVISDANGVIEYVNEEYEKTSGYSATELIGCSSDVLESSECPKALYTDMWDTLLKGKVWHGDVLHLNKQGDPYWERGSISPVYNEVGKINHFVHVKENITERKQMEEELREAKERAEDANKAKSEFLANVSHEIRTPLNSIIGFSDLLSTELQSSSLLNQVQSIKHSSNNLLFLINDILDLAKIEAGKIELNYTPVNVRVLFNELNSVFSLRHKQKGVSLNLDIDDCFPSVVFIDELRLRQIILNLWSNAIKFTSEGAVDISCTFSQNNTLTISVTDSGEGIVPGDLEEIFISFSQGKQSMKRQVEGTGLGLSISRRLARLMNGNLGVTSALGQGSTFTLNLFDVDYSDEEQETVSLKSKEQNQDISFSGQSILVVDDQLSERKYIATGLKSAGLHVFVASSGAEALEIIEKSKPDIVLTDIAMPEMDGFQLVQEVLKKHTGTPFIAMSASILKYGKRLETASEFVEVLVKPFTLDDLLAVVQNHIPEKESKAEFGEELDEKTKRLLSDKMFYQWESFADQQPLGEVTDFAKELRSIGNDIESETITNYATSLIEALENFDIETMLRILKKYPVLCERLGVSFANAVNENR